MTTTDLVPVTHVFGRDDTATKFTTDAIEHFDPQELWTDFEICPKSSGSEDADFVRLMRPVGNVPATLLGYLELQPSEKVFATHLILEAIGEQAIFLEPSIVGAWISQLTAKQAGGKPGVLATEHPNKFFIPNRMWIVVWYNRETGNWCGYLESYAIDGSDQLKGRHSRGARFFTRL